MYKKNKKGKSYTYSKVPRGGWAAPKTPRMKKSYFSPAIRKVGKDAFDALTNQYIKTVNKHVTPEKAARIMERMIEAAAGGSNQKLAGLLKEISKPLAPAVSGTVVRLITPTVGGVSGPPNVSIPSFSSGEVRRISGKNSLYTAREHTLSFKAGNSAGKWMREMAKTRSITKEIISDTLSDYQLTSPSRANLVKSVGAGRKLQSIVYPELFGETIQRVNTEFSVSALDSTTAYEQTLYGAISSLTSKMTLTSLNRYIPMYVRVLLVKNKVTVNDAVGTFADCYNLTTAAQDNGSMPLEAQSTNPNTVPGFTREVSVDPKTPGVKSAENWKNGFDVVYSKTKKLYAGDRLKFTYEHLFGSGVNISKVHGMIKESDDYNSQTQMTYSLMLEVWGEEVDVLEISSGNVIKATAPFAFQMEFSKGMKGIQADLTKDSTAGVLRGYPVNKYAVKAYSKNLVSTVAKRWNDSYSNLGVTYSVPVMSDAVEQDGGRIK